jgi:hypothetical protein
MAIKISTFQSFIFTVAAIVGINYSPLVEGVPTIYLVVIYLVIFSIAAWIYYWYFHNRHKVTAPDSEQLEILYTCCSFANAAYDTKITNDQDLSAKTKLFSVSFTDWSNDGNRSYSLITEINGKPLNLSKTSKPVKVALMSFRGTSSASEVVDDLKSVTLVDVFAMNDVEKKKSICTAGTGFVDAYYDIREMVREGKSMLDFFCKKVDDCGGLAVIVGHSLGGAMAQLMATELSLMKPNYKIALVTFGQPRLFSIESAKKNWTFEHWRAVNDGDPVPSVPPNGMGFCHHGTAFHFNTNHVRTY